MKKETFSEVLFEFPWSCGSKDCPSQWHKSTYWINITGKRSTYTIDNYSEGDHEPILKKDLPSNREQEKAWEEYRAYVAQSGRDPINHFILPAPKQITHVLQARVKQGVDRILFKGYRKTGKLSPWIIKAIPDYVKDYLDLVRISQARWFLNGFKTLVELKKTVRQAKQGDSVVIRTPYEALVNFKVVETFPMKQSEIKAFLKEKASIKEVPLSKVL